MSIKPLFMIFLIVCGSMTSCGEDPYTEVDSVGSPDGKWLLVEYRDPDGNIMRVKDEDLYIGFDITDGKGTYVIDNSPIHKSFDIKVENKKDNEYDIKIIGNISIGTAKFGTDKMVFISELEDNKTSVFKYKKQ